VEGVNRENRPGDRLRIQGRRLKPIVWSRHSYCSPAMATLCGCITGSCSHHLLVLV